LALVCQGADITHHGIFPAGEYVAVEMIESILGKNEMVEQVWVYGSSFEAVLVAVVVPNKGPLMQWAKEQVGRWWSIIDKMTHQHALLCRFLQPS
jgi:long-subunit acyl-CoA synthetase (AMP-forming)